MCLARPSLISRWRGMGWEIPVRGLRYQSCLAPCRTSTQPDSLILLTSAVHFTRQRCQPPCEFPATRRLSSPCRDRGGGTRGLPEFLLGSSSRETLGDSRSRSRLPPNKQSWLYACCVSLGAARRDRKRRTSMPRHGDIVTKSGDGTLSIAACRVHNAVREWMPYGTALAVLTDAVMGPGQPALAELPESCPVRASLKTRDSGATLGAMEADMNGFRWPESLRKRLIGREAGDRRTVWNGLKIRYPQGRVGSNLTPGHQPRGHQPIPSGRGPRDFSVSTPSSA